MTYRALDIANYVVHYALKTGKEISNLQLQKILYFLEAKSLVENDASIFEEDLEMWRLGPVVPDVYHEYKIFGSSNIDHVPTETVFYVENGDLKVRNEVFSEEKIDVEIREEIQSIVDNLIKINGFDLAEITHEHKMWKDNEQRIYDGQRGIKYDKKELREFFINHPYELEICNGRKASKFY